MKDKSYRDKYYSKKIGSVIFSTIMYELMILLTILAFNMSEDIIELGEFGWDLLVFSVMSGWLLIMLVRINRIRFKRTEDAWLKECCLPEEERDSFFLSSRTDKSIIIIIIMGMLFLSLLGLFSGSNVSGAFYIVIIASFMGLLAIEFSYNAKLKKLYEMVLPVKAQVHSIFWEEEIVATARGGIIQLVWGLVLFVYLVTSTRITQLGIAIILIGLILILAVMILRIISLRRLADEEAIERWTEKQKKENELSEAKENTPEKDSKAGETLQYSAKNHFSAIPLYKDSESFHALCEEFVSFAKDCNVTVLPEDAKQIFASMAASHALWLCSENTMYAKKVANVLQRFFTDFEGAINIPSAANTVTGLFQNGAFGARGYESELRERLCVVKERSNSVNVIAFDGYNQRDFNAVFAPFILNFRAPSLKNIIPMRDIYGYETSGMGIELQPNMWCVFVAKSAQEMPKGAQEYASAVQLGYNDAQNAPVSLKQRNRVLPYARFKELVMEASQDHFLSLDIWKKFDKLEEYLYDVCGFSITNPLARQLETHSSVLLSCEVPVMEVVDGMLANKIFPIISHLEKEQLNQEGTSFAELLDGLFGMDNIPLCQKKLSDNNWA